MFCWVFFSGKVWKPKEGASTPVQDDAPASRDDDEWKEWNEALAGATEEELVDLAGAPSCVVENTELRYISLHTVDRCRHPKNSQ